MYRFLRVLLRNGTKLLGRFSCKAQTPPDKPPPRFLPRWAGQYISTYITLALNILHTGRVRDSHMGLLLGPVFPARFLADASPSSPPAVGAVGCRMWASIHLAAKIEQFGVVDLQERKQEDGSYRVDGKCQWMD